MKLLSFAENYRKYYIVIRKGVIVNDEQSIACRRTYQQ